LSQDDSQPLHVNLGGNLALDQEKAQTGW
jgi:hypothetical protein